MKNIRLGSAVLAALAIVGSAQAADLPLKAPPLAAPVSWTGFYAGAGLGFRSAVTDAPLVSELTAAGIGAAFADADLSGVQTAHTLTGTAFRASPYVGFNWQFAPSWVSGIEPDFGFAHKTVTRDGVFLPTGLNGIDSEQRRYPVGEDELGRESTRPPRVSCNAHVTRICNRWCGVAALRHYFSLRMHRGDHEFRSVEHYPGHDTGRMDGRWWT